MTILNNVKINGADYLGKESEALEMMTPLLLKAGFSKDDLARLARGLTQVESTIYFLAIFQNEWAAAQNIYTLPGMSPEVWNRYELLDMVNLEEQVLLSKALNALYFRMSSFLRNCK